MAREKPTLRRLVRRVGPAEAGRALLDVLAAWVPELADLAVSRARLRALIVAGEVYVDGLQRRSPGYVLRAGAKLDARLRRAALVSPLLQTDRPFALSAASILYRDEWLIAVDKPAGLPTHATADPSRPNLVAALQAHLAAGGRGSYVAVHQRLDRDTSGVVLFAIDPAANEGLAAGFVARDVEKTYLALVTPAGSGAVTGAAGAIFTIDAPLSVDASGRVRAGGPGAKPAATAVRVRERLGGLLLVEAHPATGRKHQVRVHLAHAGLPIAGDALYARGGPQAATLRPPRLMLHASRLVLPHPISGRRLVLESPLPADFERVLRAARR